MELNKREIELIRFALNERIDRNKKLLETMKRLGENVEEDKVAIMYAEEIPELEALFEKLSDEYFK